MDLIITHLTDIHFKSEADLGVLAERTDSIVGAIAEVVRKPQETLLLICVTGDIAFSGLEQEYIMAELFFDDIYEKIKTRFETIKFFFVFVPGNHDCDFEDGACTVRKSILCSQEVNMDDNRTISLCTTIQQKYFEFVEKFAQKDIAIINKKDNIFTENTLTVEGFEGYSFRLHCINTAWCSKKKETKDMLFSIPMGIQKKREKDIVITLMHHNPKWFNWTGENAWEAYHKEFSDIILIGHDHKSKFIQERNYDSKSNYFIMGNQLYSPDEVEESGFNIFKVDLDNNTEVFYTYSWEKNLYKRIIDSGIQVFEKNRFSELNSKLTEEMKSYLEDVEVSVSSKYKSSICLSDIYVFPTLYGDESGKANKMKAYRGKEQILTVIQEKKKVVINGRKEYGKTALVKTLFLNYYNEDAFPVLLDVSTINSADEANVNNAIRDCYQKQYYNLNVDEIMQKHSSEKVCFIDNFDEIRVSDKTQKRVLEYINTQFDIVIITLSNQNAMVDSITNLETYEYVNTNFYQLRIGKFRQYGRNEMVEKWLLLENPMQNVKTKEFDVKRKNILSQMDTVLKNGYFSNTPLEFLLVLSFLDNAESINTDYSRYSYVYDCLIREQLNEISGKDTKIALAYVTLLQILAYDLYQNDERNVWSEQYLLTAIAKYNENYPPFRQNSTKIIQSLLNCRIIEERNEMFRFKYNYMYYYFAGSYIVDNLSPEERKCKMEEIISDLSLESNYNIALFMAYSANPQYDILPKIEQISSKLLVDYQEFKYVDQRGLLNKINSNILARVDELYYIPENDEIPEIQRKWNIEQDDLAEIEEQEKENKKEEIIKGLEEDFKEFIKLLRIIEFQGDILKNYGTKIKNEPRKKLIEIMGLSNLKLIGFWCERISLEIDKIIGILEKKIKEEGKQEIPEKDNLLTLIRNYMGLLWSEFIEINVDNLAGCLECDLLEQDIIDFKEKKQSDFFDMVAIEYKLRVYDGHLPVSDIEKCFNGKKKLGSFSQNILKHIIAMYLTTYQYDNKEKEQVCSLLGFNYKKLFIEGKKSEILETKQDDQVSID